MGRYVVKRILQAIPVFLIITFAVYVLINYAPGGPIETLMESGNLSQADYEALKHSLGLDRNIFERYFLWLAGLFQGNLGTSYRTGKAVSGMIAERIGNSLILTGTGILGAILIGLPIGVMSAVKPGSGWDKAGNVLSFISASFPSFFMSLLLIYVFAVRLKVLPANGMYSVTGAHTAGNLARHLILPAFVCGIQPIKGYIKQTKMAVMDVLNEEYIKTARSKGLSERTIILKHAVRNALIPVVTQLSLSIPFLIGGAVVVEQIFAWPGIGSLMISGITNRDYPVVMGVTVLIAVVVLVTNLLLDILYARLDPRITYK